MCTGAYKELTHASHQDKKELTAMDDIKHYSIGSDIWFFIRYYRQYEPIVLVCCGAEILLGALLPLLGIYLPKIAIDLAAQRTDASQVLILLGGFTLLLTFSYGVKNGITQGKYNLYNTHRTNMMGQLFLKSLRVKYEYTESGSMRKVYRKGASSLQSGDWSASSQIVTGTISLLVSIISFFLYSTVIGYLSLGMLAVLLVLSAANYLLSMSQIRYEESLRDEYATAWKHYSYVNGVMGDVRRAKDIRIFSMRDWLVQLRDQTVEEVKTVDEKSKRKASFYQKIGYTLAAARDLGAYAYLLYQTTTGEVTAGEFVLFFGAITGFSGFLTGIMDSLALLRGAANSADYFRAYLELPEEDRTTGRHHINELSFPPEIEFRNVSFSYHGSEDDQEEASSRPEKIFQNLNLIIHPGERLALVGINGAGKTTLIKLLCGMYEPEEGQILIDGIDRNEFPRQEIYQLFSVVFQEQLILPFTVGENLAMDRAERVDEHKAWSVLEKAGLKELFCEKGVNLKTYMTKAIMEDGLELSGGQQQRFLLARALYKDGPILVLDEPTAALDPIAESEVYSHYNQYSQGKTALFISHRLASTRFSDRIILFENGRILEEGTHEELMAAGGAYAEMFEIQSSYYHTHSSERK